MIIPPDLLIYVGELLDQIKLTPLEVRNALSSLPIGKASSPDDINDKTLKELALEIL